MRRIVLCMVVGVATVFAAMAQEGLNVAEFFSDAYTGNPKVTLVSMSYDKVEKNGMRKYRSISVEDSPELADKIGRAVSKAGASAVSTEVSYREGQLYFGFYSMGGKRSARRYLLYLNRRPKGKEKTTLIFIEGNLSDAEVKRMINK